MMPTNNNPVEDIDLIQFLDALSIWFGGMSQFMAATKSEWRNVPTGYHIMAQRLRKNTLDLERDAKALSFRLKAQEAGDGQRS